MKRKCLTMHLAGKAKVEDFLKHHDEVRQDVSELIRDLEQSRFATPAELLEKYPSARALDGKRVVFKIRGNKYRLCAIVAYNIGVMVIDFVGTHAQYDRRKF